MTSDFNRVLKLDKCMRVIIRGRLHVLYEEVVETNRPELLESALATLYVCLS